jgi:hypothetical protein
MSEIIVLSRDQYAADMYQVALSAATEALKRYKKTDHPAIVTRAQASRILGKSKATIKKLIDTQRMRTTSDGLGIPYSEIERYLNEN